jgi:hypothetical protein
MDLFVLDKSDLELVSDSLFLEANAFSNVTTPAGMSEH